MFRHHVIPPAIALCFVAIAGAAVGSGNLTELTAAAYPEGPLWRNNKLYYVEYSTDRVIVWDGTSAQPLWTARGCGASGMISFGKDHFLVTCYDSNSVVEIDGMGKQVHAFIADDAGNAPPGPNDFAADPKGGVYFTASGDAKIKKTGELYHLSADGKRMQRLAENVENANGIALSADGRTLLVAQTRLRQIMAFPINGNGTLGERAVWAKLSDISPDDERHGPDGLKRGPDGNYYIAQNGAGRILVVDKNKKLVRTIDVPTPSVTNMEFGPNGSLFITGMLENKAPYPGRVYQWTP